MISYDYTKKDFSSFSDGIRREWAITNGIGGYAGSSLIGAHNRTHQGYLIASLHPPVERFLVFSKINERVAAAGKELSFETSQHLSGGKTVYAEGQKYLETFSYDGSAHYFYRAGGISMKKHITLKRGENVCAVAYELRSAEHDAQFTLTPLFNFREHSASSVPETLRFDTSVRGRTFSLVPQANPAVAIRFQVSGGEFAARKDRYDADMQLQTEVDLETPGLDSHFCPIDVRVRVPAGQTVRLSVLCSVCDAAVPLPDIGEDAAFSLLEDARAYRKELLLTAGYEDDFANRLVLAADQFFAYRASTKMSTVLAGLPWFTDWGRDTMIAFTGLALCTKRFREAEEILLTFAQYIRHGLVPNMFPDDGQSPLYNTVDASLWYFYAVYQYEQYAKRCGRQGASVFIREKIYPHLKEILAAYEQGTDFDIYMDTDGLIHAGSGLDQITWMDVRVGDWVATPRHGKPVEINALWYNAQKVMAHFAESFGEDASGYEARAAQIKDSFCKKFWDEAHACLIDVADGDAPDDHLRPNQIYAVSLPFTMLPEEKEAAVVAFVEKYLYVGCGLRSLVPSHPDYHGVYCGALPKRDAAYHQGTAWGFLLGGFFTAYLKVHRHSPESIAAAREMLAPIKKHLTDSGCIGSISEIFDGDAPHTPRGCYAQAWSVGEVLRCYCEDVM